MWDFTADVSQPVLLEFLGELGELERIYADDRALRERRIKAVFPVATPY